MTFPFHVVTQLVLLSGFALLVTPRCRNRLAGRRYLVALGVLAFGSLIPHAEFIRTHANGQFHVHPTEFYHYYLGTRYFDEIGYYGLYEAVVVAGYEADPIRFEPERTIRHLRNPEFEIRMGDVLRRKAEIKRHFSPERWQLFKKDVAYFRTFDFDNWATVPPERDHGYNGTPVTTAVLGFVASQGLVPTSTFVPIAAWFDLVLIVALVLVLGRLFDWEFGFAFLALWSLNPLNDFAYNGGAYLRHCYFVALALGLALFAREKLASSAAALVPSVGFQIFPGVFPLAIASHDLLNPDPIGRVRSHWRLYASLAVVAALLFGVTSFVRTPDDRNGWVAFSERISRHTANRSSNRIGLKYLFSYSPEHQVGRWGQPTAAGKDAADWQGARQKTFEERKVGFYTVAALGLLASLVFLRSVPAAQAPFAGLLWLFLLISPSHYYYGVLGIIPIVFARDRRVWLLFAGLSATLLVLGSTDVIRRSADLKYVSYSAAVGCFLVAVLVMKLARPVANHPSR